MRRARGAIGFTGATEVGKLLMRQAAGTVKRVGLAPRGNAPLSVFDDADLAAAVAGAVTCKDRNVGQACVCAQRPVDSPAARGRPTVPGNDSKDTRCPAP